MKHVFYVIIALFNFIQVNAQQLPSASPCTTNQIYRQFDFWIGDWEVYNLKGNKAGESKISLILDSCVILEEWTSLPIPGGFIFKGKSFNTYNGLSKQWQENWTDNVGGNTNYIYGQYADGNIVFTTDPWQYAKDTLAVNKLTFFNLGADKVRQLGELSKDKGRTWSTQYDLEYRRKKK
jgi:hypothetical protein